MATNNSISENQKTNVIVISGDDEILHNILSIIRKSENSSQIITETTENNIITTSRKRRKTDLTCVICGDKCSGYNFNVISCGSCKSFFQRNAAQNLSKLECLTNSNNCDIKFNNRRRICRRCRLQKCLSVGMKWNSSAREEKLNRQQQLEENRRLTKNTSTTLAQTNSADSAQLINDIITTWEPSIYSITDQLQITPYMENFFLTPDDYDRINLVKFSDEKAFRLTTGTRGVSIFDRIIDQRSALLYSLSTCYDFGMKLLLFIRNIPEFEALNEQDRFILFKYNSPLVFLIRSCLHYDINKDLIIYPDAENEDYAIACKQMSYYCFGEQFCLQTNQLYRSIKKIADNDPIILQLMTIILMFTKSVSIDDSIATQELILTNSKQVYEAQSVYTSLLFRYMIKKYSTYYQAVCQYSRLIQKTIQMQMLSRKYQHFFQERLIDTTDEEINPILKSILHLH